MDGKTILIELLVAGFFGVACMRAREHPGTNLRLSLGDLFSLPTRLERLRRSRWQWFAMVAFMLVLRLQDQLPVAVELMAALEFAVFLALPVKATAARTPLKQ
jgi:hypothetical protein